MLWFFERDEQSLRLETRYDNDTSEYVVIVRYQDGREQTERFTEADKFRSWLVTFERSIEGQHWTRHGDGPVLLPDGWPDKRLT